MTEMLIEFVKYVRHPYGASSSDIGPGKKLCDAVYLLQEPEGYPEIEIVFIHGLQNNGNQDAYWKTWLVQSSDDQCWPATWFKVDPPNARVLSLSYDACWYKTPTTGRMDLYALGESLLHVMIFSEVKIGQKNCPVVFVGHRFGGIVAKQIAVTAHEKSQSDMRIGKLLRNIKGFFYYGTAHAGSVSELECSARLLRPEEGDLVTAAKVLNDEVGRLDDKFTSASKHYVWEYFVVAGAHETRCSSSMVEETSARVPGYPFLKVGADHNNICKPTSKNDISFLALANFLTKIVKSQERDLLLLPSGLSGMTTNQNTLIENLAENEVVGVVGMGGIGKTILCMSVYNLHCRRYGRSCFLENIKSKSLEAVQLQLYKDLMGEEIGRVERRHLTEISHCIKEQKVLIVYDDVWNEQDKLDKLQIQAFKEGRRKSRAILTARNWQLLKAYTKVKIEIQLLDEKSSFEVFNFHAFRSIESQTKRADFEKREDENAIELDDLYKAIVKYCGGLPLSLEVIGSFLGVREDVDLEIWKDAKKRLELAESFTGGCDNEKLWSKLRICFDALDKQTFEMIAYIVTFKMSAEKRNDTVAHLNSRFSKLTVQNLVDRSLVQIKKLDREEFWTFDRNGYFNIVTIHDQLRDLGLKIVSERGLSTAFGVWDKVITNDSLTSEMMAADKLEVLAICTNDGVSSMFSSLRDSSNQKVFKFSSLKELFIEENVSEEELLEVEKIKNYVRQWLQEILHEIYKDWTILYRPSHLRTRLSSFKYNDHIDMANVLKQVYMSMQSGRYLFNHYVEDIATSIIHCSYCIFNTMFTEQLPCLESLTVTGCSLRLSGTLDFCPKLRWLLITDCLLDSLPTSFGTKVNLLEYIGIEDCKYFIEIPEQFGNLTSLKILDVRFCEKLEELPAQLGNLSNLEVLLVLDCETFRYLPEFSSKNIKLNLLHLEDCDSLRVLPSAIANLQNLQALKINNCSKLDRSSVVKIIDRVHLKYLSIKAPKSHMVSSDDFPSSALQLPCCHSGSACSPCDLHDYSSSSYYSLDPYDRSPLDYILVSDQLEYLHLESYSMKSLQYKELELSQLRIMYLDKCTDLTGLPPSIGRLLQLEELHVNDIMDHFELPEELVQLPKLQILDLEWYSCGESTSLPVLEKLSQLKALSLIDMGLEYLPESFKDFTRMKMLDLSYCRNLRWTEECQMSILKAIHSRGCRITLPNCTQFHI